jgi:hypothetical protein
MATCPYSKIYLVTECSHLRPREATMLRNLSMTAADAEREQGEESGQNRDHAPDGMTVAQRS